MHLGMPPLCYTVLMDTLSRELGWTVLVIWECELRTISKREQLLPDLYDRLASEYVEKNN